MDDTLFYFEELRKLVGVYADEIISVRKYEIPEDDSVMQELLDMNLAFRADLAELGQKAKDIYHKYNL